MRPRRHSPLLVAALLAGALAGRGRAQESLDDIAGASDKEGAAKESADKKAKTVEVNGYLVNRLSGSLIDPGASAAPTQDFPSLRDMLEANVQLKVHLGDKAFIYGDLSLFVQGGWLYYTRDPQGGGRVAVDDHDVPSLRPQIITSELYASYSPKPWLNLLAGKKRIVWGSGVAFNPTDLINPPKDPTDPNLQRAGAWLARAELPFEKFTVSALFSPTTLYTANGLPYAMMKYPSFKSAENLADQAHNPDVRDEDYHYLVAGRLYALLFDADVSLMYFFSNKYQDGFANKSRIGASFSRYFFTDYELHVDAMFQKGSARSFVDHACATGGACANPLAAYSASKIDKDAIYSRVLVGGRTVFRDESSLSVEYYYQGDGDSDLEFDDRVRALLLARTLIEKTGLTVQNGLPTRFGFDPLRRHYLIASYSKPRIHDDWTITGVLIAGLRDLSGLANLRVDWSAKEWLTLSASGYVPIRWVPVGQTTVDGKSYSEFGLTPYDFQVMFEARAFY